jgi:hypothetical protein
LIAGIVIGLGGIFGYLVEMLPQARGAYVALAAVLPGLSLQRTPRQT